MLNQRCSVPFVHVVLALLAGWALSDSIGSVNSSVATTENGNPRSNELLKQLKDKNQHRFRRFDTKPSFEDAWSSVVTGLSSNKTVLPHQSVLTVSQVQEGVAIQPRDESKSAKVIVDPVFTGQLAKNIDHLVMTNRDSSIWVQGSDSAPIYVLQFAAVSEQLIGLMNRPVSDFRFVGSYQSFLQTSVSRTALFGGVNVVGFSCENHWYIAATSDEDVLMPLCLQEAAATAKEDGEKQQVAKLQEMERERNVAAERRAERVSAEKRNMENTVVRVRRQSEKDIFGHDMISLTVSVKAGMERNPDALAKVLVAILVGELKKASSPVGICDACGVDSDGMEIDGAFVEFDPKTGDFTQAWSKPFKPDFRTKDVGNIRDYK